MARPPGRMPRFNSGPAGPGTPPRHRYPHPNTNPPNHGYRNSNDFHSNDYPVNPTKESYAALSASLQSSLGVSQNNGWSNSGSSPNPRPINVNHPPPPIPNHANSRNYEQGARINSYNNHSNTSNTRVGSNERSNNTTPRPESMEMSHAHDYYDNTPRRYVNKPENHGESNGVLKLSVYETAQSPDGRRPIPQENNYDRNQAQANKGQWSNQRPMRPNSSSSRPEKPHWIGKQEFTPTKSRMGSVTMSPDVLLRNFRSLECSMCYNHMGFQVRNQPAPQNMYCSIDCVNRLGSLSDPVVQAQQPFTPERVLTSIENRPKEDLVNRKVEPHGPVGGAYPAERPGPASQVHVPNQSQPENKPPTSGPVVNRQPPGRAPEPKSTERQAPGQNDNHQRVGNGGGGQGERQGRGYGRGDGKPARKNSVPFGSRQGESPFTQVGDDDTEWGGDDDDTVDNKVTKGDEDLRAVCNEVVSLAQSRTTPKKPPVVVPELKDVYITEQVILEKPKPTTKDTANFVPTKPDNIKKVQVYPNPSLYNLSPKLAWSEFPMNVPSIVYRTHSNCPTDFYVQDFNSHRLAKEMAEEICKHIAGKGLKPNLLGLTAEVQDLCLAPFGGEFYRGEIVELLPGERAKIFFSDFGNIDEVSSKDLWVLPPNLAIVSRLITNGRWDMALTDELDEGRIKAIFADDSKPILATEKICDGQYIFRLEQYTPYSHFIIHPTPRGFVGQAASSASKSESGSAPDSTKSVISQARTAPLRAGQPDSCDLDPPRVRQMMPAPHCQVGPALNGPPPPRPAPGTERRAPPRPEVVPAKSEPDVERPQRAPARPAGVIPARPESTVERPRAPPKAQPTLDKATSERGFPECDPIRTAPTVVEPVAPKTTPLADILATPKPLVPRAPSRPAEPEPPRTPARQPSNRKVYMFNDMSLTKGICPNGDVRLAFCWNMKRFFVTANEDGTNAFVVQSLIAEHLPKSDGLDEDIPKVGEVLLGDYGANEYYRAVIVGVDVAKRSAMVEFIDFGDSAENQFDQLRIPTEEIMKHPVYGMTVVLDLQEKSPPRAVTTEIPEEITGLFGKPMQIEFREEFRCDAKVFIWINEDSTVNDLVDDFFKRYATKGHF